MPKVSIITASYNYAEYIGQTIKSVINQTYQDWEMIVIDDGSKDNSIEIVDKYVKKDLRIKLLTHPNNENRGLVETLRFGIAQAQGEYIVFLESDDYIREDYLEKKLGIFNKYSDAGFVYNGIQTFGSQASLKRQLYFALVNDYWKRHNYPHNISEMFYLRNYVPTFSCVMLKKDLLNNLNWDAPDKACIDLWLWVQISAKTYFYYLPEKLTFWRLHEDSYLNVSRKNNSEKTLQFYAELCEMLPQIKNVNIIVQFVFKQIMIFFQYKKWVQGSLKHIWKKGE